MGDHGVRKYSPEIGRFTSVDKLWEKYYSWTPYHYCLNNSVNLKDNNGLWANEFGGQFSAELSKMNPFGGDYEKETHTTLGNLINNTCYYDFKNFAPKIASSIENMNTAVFFGDGLENWQHAAVRSHPWGLRPVVVEFNESNFIVNDENKIANMRTVLHEYIHLNGGDEFQAFSGAYAYMVNKFGADSQEAQDAFNLYFGVLSDERRERRFYGIQGMPNEMQNKIFTSYPKREFVDTENNREYLKQQMLKTGNEQIGVDNDK